MKKKLEVLNVPVSEILSDPDSFSVFFDHYFSRIYNYIRFKVSCQDLADDLTSRVFEKILAGIHSYNPEKGKLDSWIFRIAHNVIIDFLRSEKPVNYIDDYSSVPQNESSMDDNLIAAEMKGIVLQAVGKLSEIEQNVITLKFWGGLGNGQIAQITGLTTNNVGVIIFRSLKKLRVLLQEEELLINE